MRCVCLSFYPEVEELAVKPAGERPQKRRCFWEYRRARESAAKKRLAGEMRWSLSWSSSTLPSTLYRREGEHVTEAPPNDAHSQQSKVHKAVCEMFCHVHLTYCLSLKVVIFN